MLAEEVSIFATHAGKLEKKLDLEGGGEATAWSRLPFRNISVKFKAVLDMAIHDGSEK